VLFDGLAGSVCIHGSPNQILTSFHFFHCENQETTCLLSELLSKVTVTSHSYYVRCSMCPPCCWTTHSESAPL